MNGIKYEDKVWGKVFHIFDEITAVSLLEVKSGFCCSIHKHEHRWNHFFVISGVLKVNFFRKSGDSFEPWYNRILLTGESIKVSPGTIHQFEVLGSGRIVEAYWTTDGTEVNLDDIVRYSQGGPINVNP